MAKKKAFEFIRLAERPSKPRDVGVTEVRGPYSAVVGLSYLKDLLSVAGEYIDILKFAGGSQRLIDYDIVRDMVKECHEHDVMVSTGGFLERAFSQGFEAVEQFMEEAKALEFDVIEVSSGIAILPLEDKIEICKMVKETGLKAKPEVAMAYGINPETTVEINAEKLISEAKTLLREGAWKIMIESEGITESVKEWKTDVIHKIASSFDLKDIMFEAADTHVFEWYIKNYGPYVNLFVDHSQILRLEAVRTGLWGEEDTWGRVVSFRQSLNHRKKTH
jgi:phosphosulfolactate synthase (CoM biosynthesis protein A)